jgi:hypothetical protein
MPTRVAAIHFYPGATPDEDRVQILDEIVAEDPVTGVRRGVGAFVDPHTWLTEAEAPGLFAALRSYADGPAVAARTEAKRVAYLDRTRPTPPEGGVP